MIQGTSRRHEDLKSRTCIEGPGVGPTEKLERTNIWVLRVNNTDIKKKISVSQ
jgi:hypothetical protein